MARGKIWNELEVNFIRDNAGKLTVKEMADQIGRSYFSVRALASKINLSLATVYIKNNNTGTAHRLSFDAVEISAINQMKMIRDVFL